MYVTDTQRGSAGPTDGLNLDQACSIMDFVKVAERIDDDG